MARALFAAAAAASLAACIQYSDLPTEPVRPAEPVRMYLSVHHAGAPAGAPLLAHGELHPGREEAGPLRGLDDPSLGMGSALLYPILDPDFDQFLYQGLVDPGDPEDPLVVRFPRVAGVRDHPADVRIGRPARVGPDTLVLADTGALVLRVAPPGVADAGETTWWLNVSGPSGALSLFRRGALPAEIRVPREMLPGRGAEVLSARLGYRYDLSDEEREPMPDYRVWVQFSAELGWTVVPTT